MSSYTLSPLAITQVLDHFQRREKKSRRVFGTLLGNSKAQQVSITNVIPAIVRENEEEDTFHFNLDHHQKLLELHKKVYPKDEILGWFTAGFQHDAIGEASNRRVATYFYNHISNSTALVLFIDLTEALSIKAYHAHPIDLSFGTKQDSTSANTDKEDSASDGDFALLPFLFEMIPSYLIKKDQLTRIENLVIHPFLKNYQTSTEIQPILDKSINNLMPSRQKEELKQRLEINSLLQRDLLGEFIANLQKLHSVLDSIHTFTSKKVHEGNATKEENLIGQFLYNAVVEQVPKLTSLKDKLDRAFHEQVQDLQTVQQLSNACKVQLQVTENLLLQMSAAQ